MIMVKCHICIALAAEQSDLSEDFTVAFRWCKTAVVILNVAGRYNHILCDLNKITIITAVWANDATEWFTF